MDEACFLILTGGNLYESLIVDFLQKQKECKIICVDGALALADKMNLSIDYLVGDYDTISPDIISKYRERVKMGELKTKIYSFQAEKDETDTEIAISLALKLNANEICLMGATGTRMDHVLANIHLLQKPLKQKVSAYMLDRNNRIYLKDSSFQVEKNKLYGPYFSLVPFGGKVKAVTLSGFKYNTHSIDYQMGCSFGVSNELLLEKGNVSFQEGTFIVIEAND